ncbi:MAG: hypothetical protein BWX96_00818 [Bacteroidetes bacterium ADurb.Bin145]|nr:MAG: hypothetical protein BWX96_00818 [Bacteroidetes bacterium ADurb.Bin145]
MIFIRFLLFNEHKMRLTFKYLTTHLSPLTALICADLRNLRENVFLFPADPANFRRNK